jgi:copper(I)-binding protein
MKKATLVIAALTASAALLAACGSDDSSSSEQVSVNDAWARVTAPTATMGAVYMNLESADGDTLLSASVPSDIAGKTEIHETVDSEEAMDPGSTMDTMEEGMSSEEGTSMEEDSSMDASMMGMREVDSIELPAGQEVKLEPGGYHVMLLDLKQPIEMGDTIEVTLDFQNAGEINVEAGADEG